MNAKLEAVFNPYQSDTPLIVSAEGRHPVAKMLRADSLEMATLLAAAPELLEVLEDLCSYFQEWGKDYPDDAHRFDAAQAAINKARGRATR